MFFFISIILIFKKIRINNKYFTNAIQKCTKINNLVTKRLKTDNLYLKIIVNVYVYSENVCLLLFF